MLFLLAPLYCHDASQMENRNMVMVVVVDFTINEIYVLYNGCFYIFWVWLVVTIFVHPPNVIPKTSRKQT